MCEKMSNKWDIMLSLFTNNKDTNLKREYLVYEHELITMKTLYSSVNVIRSVKIIAIAVMTADWRIYCKIN